MSQAILWKDDPAYPLNAAFNSRQLDIRPGLNDRYMEVNTAKTGVIVRANTIIPVLSGSTWKAYLFSSDSEVTTLDTGSLTLGNNYYVYLCDNGTDSGLLLISLNATAPSGYTASNSRKIGGLHYGRIRNSITISDVTSGAVVPNSVWDLVHRPRCTPEGMVDLGNGTWVDIYLASVNEAITFNAGNGSPITAGSCKSVYNAVPLTGTEGLNAYSFAELARRSGKRLLSMQEWLMIAHGSPQGNDADNLNAWTATTNTARANTGSVVNAISLLGVVDCVGNIWEWVDDRAIRRDGAAGPWAWQDVMSGQGVGKLYMYSNIDLAQIVVGGAWSDGVKAGSRCANLNIYPWILDSSIGARFACDSL